MYTQTISEIEEDAVHIERSKSDPAAFSFLYKKYHKRIFLYVMNAVRDEPDAADMTTEVFIKALQHLVKYEHKGLPFSAWLYKIAMNELNSYRRVKSRVGYVALAPEQIKEEFEMNPIDMESWLRCLTKSMQDLDAVDFNLLQFRFTENKSFRDMGSILGCSEDNAKTKTYRILKKLKPLIERCYAKI